MWTSTDCSPIDFCLQNYNFSTNPQGDGCFSLFTEMQAGMSSLRGHVCWHGIYACGLLFLPFDFVESSISLERKGTKVQGRLHRTSPRLSKRLTLRSRSAFGEGKRQAPLREGQALSHPLRALPRPAAPPPRPTRSGFGVPDHGVRCSNFRS